MIGATEGTAKQNRCSATERAIQGLDEVLVELGLAGEDGGAENSSKGRKDHRTIFKEAQMSRSVYAK